jgi:hypothetical protein
MAESMEKPFGHEPDGIRYRTVLICIGILALVVIAIAVGLHFVMSQAVIPNHAAVLTRPGRVPPEPRLQAHPRFDLAKFRAHKNAILSGYAWGDAGHDFARIPIQRAMQIYVQRHARAAPAPASSAAPASAPGSAKPAAQGTRP